MPKEITQRQLNRIEKLVSEQNHQVGAQYTLLRKKAQRLCVYRHADSWGNVTCFTCGAVKKANSKGMHGGHYISRKAKPTCYLQINLRPQCYQCNAKHIGNGQPEIFTERLGPVHVAHLKRLAGGPQPFTSAGKHDSRKLFRYMVLILEPKGLFHEKRIKPHTHPITI